MVVAFFAKFSEFLSISLVPTDDNDMMIFTKLNWKINMYTFVLTDMGDWRLKITPNDLEIFHAVNQVHMEKRVVFWGSGNCKTSPSHDNIDMMTRGRIRKEELLKSGKTLLLNSVGGFCLETPNNSLKEFQKDRCIWPSDIPDTATITISQYAQESASHWYISPSWATTFVPRKFNHVEDAIELAESVLPSERITIRNKYQ